MTSGPDEVITRRSRVECRKEIPWCLWCLLRPEIGAILYGTVERVADCETVEIASIDAVFAHVAKNMLG